MGDAADDAERRADREREEYGLSHTAAATCPFCFQALHDGSGLERDDDGRLAHGGCIDMDRSSMFGDWITSEYE